MVKLLAKTGVAVTATVDPNVPSLILSDRQRLVQVLLNLMTNAMKYTDSGSVHLSARTARVDPPTAIVAAPPSTAASTVTAAPQAPAAVEYLVIRCEDTGRGVPPQHQPNLFTTRFCTVPGSRAGTGLGLAVSKILVEKLGGEMSVESDENDDDAWPPPGTTGAAFIVRLPIVCRPAQGPSPELLHHPVQVQQQQVQADGRGGHSLIRYQPP